MSGPHTALPVLGVEPGHLAEARRALAAQGRIVDDDAVERLLWTARVLPAALDLLADAQSPTSLADACFTGLSLERGEAPATPGAPLLLLARTTATGIGVEVVELYPWLDHDEVRVRYRIHLTVSPVPPGPGVRVVRFQLG